MSKVVKWNEPYQGMTRDGTTIDVNVSLEASAEGCVAIARYNLSANGHQVDHLSDEELLDEFVTVNWASVVEVPRG